MQKLSIDNDMPLKIQDESKIDLSYWNYQEPYKFIAQYMRSKNIYNIGDINSVSKAIIKSGDQRCASVDLIREDRAIRSLTITKLQDIDLDKLHEYELNKMDRLLFGSEIQKVIKSFIKWDHKIEPHQMEYLIVFQDEHRPEPKKFHGISIPAYFPLDNTFDGMIYHHQWDRVISLNKHKMCMPTGIKHKESKSKEALENE